MRKEEPIVFYLYNFLFLLCLLAGTLGITAGLVAGVFCFLSIYLWFGLLLCLICGNGLDLRLLVGWFPSAYSEKIEDWIRMGL